uniref:Uncharacterized protein n=1 Tax=Caenorhabditis tropicalis TaxID=1561998 RepID=A0A1I7UV68_9PELO
MDWVHAEPAILPRERGVIHYHHNHHRNPPQWCIRMKTCIKYFFICLFFLLIASLIFLYILHERNSKAREYMDEVLDNWKKALIS